MKNHVVNLDLPANIRYEKIIPEYIEPIKELGKEFPNILKSELGLARFPIKFFAKFLSTIPDEFLSELEGIAKLTAIHGLTLNKLILLNIGHDYLARCTAGVIELNKSIIHIRTMDWENPRAILEKMTFTIDYIRDGKIIYKGVSWLGMVGLYTGMNENIAINLNYREKDNNIFNSSILTSFIAGFFRGYSVTGMIIRQVLEKNSSYESSFLDLCLEPLISPCYLIISGKSRYHVITRGRDDYKLKYNNQNFLIQSNHDQFANSDSRFHSEHKGLMQTTFIRETELEHIFQTIGNKFELVNRIHNNKIIWNKNTVYCALMNVEKFELSCIT